MAGFNQKHYELLPTPTTATTAQTKYIPIDYRVLFQCLVPKMCDILDLDRLDFGNPAAVLAHVDEIRMDLNSFLIMSGQLEVIRAMGRDAPVEQRRQAFDMFFRRRTFRFKDRDVENATYFLCSDGKGLSWSLRRPWDDEMGVPYVPEPWDAEMGISYVPRKSFVDDANTLENVDLSRVRRGAFRLDRGVEGLEECIAGLDPQVEPVIGVDPGIANVVTVVNADIVGMVNQNPDNRRQIFRHHVLQVSHGTMRQNNFSKTLERKEEKLRDNDFRINAWYDFLSETTPRRLAAGLEERCAWIHWVAMARHEVFLDVYQRSEHRQWRFRAFATRQRAEQMLVNRIAGRCRWQEWRDVQRRLVPGAKQLRRVGRQVNGFPPYDTGPRLFAWGDGSWAHQRPWAPVPRTVSF